MAVLGSLVLAVPTFAQNSGTTSPLSELRDNRGGMMGWGKMMLNMRSGVIGTVASVNGTTLTVASVKVGWDRDGQDRDENKSKTTPTPITYTVDASKATVVKAGVASIVSAIAVGDKVMVQGAITGTNIVATAIRDGINKDEDKDKDDKNKVKKPSPTPLILGNGQPVIAGTISAINGTSLTITNKSNITYTVDASTAKVQNKGVLSTLSTVVVGDNVVVQGAINGTSVTAYSVIDQGATATVSPNSKSEGRGNMFGGIGRFLQHLFGF